MRTCESTENAVIKLYQEGHSSYKIAKILNVCKSSVINILSRRGVPRRPIGHHKKKHTFDTDFFLNLEGKQAYWLGFLYADGCIFDNKMMLGLSRKDEGHLKKFKQDIKATHPILRTEWYSKKYSKTYKTSRFNIYSKSLCDSLRKIGCNERKSLTLTFPTLIPEASLSHFMRGYFDGDGGITAKTRVFSIIGTHAFLSKYLEILNKFCGLEKTTLTKATSCEMYYILYYGRENLRPIYNFLYSDDSTPFLNRKKHEFRKAILPKRV